jgi:hypothetical protein
MDNFVVGVADNSLMRLVFDLIDIVVFHIFVVDYYNSMSKIGHNNNYSMLLKLYYYYNYFFHREFYNSFHFYWCNYHFCYCSLRFYCSFHFCGNFHSYYCNPIYYCSYQIYHFDHFLNHNFVHHDMVDLDVDHFYHNLIVHHSNTHYNLYFDQNNFDLNYFVDILLLHHYYYYNAGVAAEVDGIVVVVGNEVVDVVVENMFDDVGVLHELVEFVVVVVVVVVEPVAVAVSFVVVEFVAVAAVELLLLLLFLVSFLQLFEYLTPLQYLLILD